MAWRAPGRSWHRVYAGEPLPSLEDFELLMLLDDFAERATSASTAGWGAEGA